MAEPGWLATHVWGWTWLAKVAELSSLSSLSSLAGWLAALAELAGWLSWLVGGLSHVWSHILFYL